MHRQKTRTAGVVSVVIHLVKTIEAHVGGQPLRLLVDGATRPVGSTPARRMEWLRRRADHIRRGVVLPPRGHADMVAAQLMDPIASGAHAAVAFMDSSGYRAMSAHGLIAAATIAVERELLYRRGEPVTPIAFETVAGVVQARVRVKQGHERLRVDAVTITNLPAFVHLPGYVVKMGSRELRVDVAFGGLFYAIADTEAVGVPLTVERLPELRRLAVDLTRAVNGSLEVLHPVAPVSGVAGIVFTGPPQDPESHLRAVTITGGGAVNWSPGGTGMAAVMSVLDAMELLPEGASFVQEGLSGAVFHGESLARTTVGDVPAIVTTITGSAWITGEQVLHLDDDDPFREGIGPA